MSIARHHAEWLSLLEISGPFLSMPVLLNAFPQGLEAHDAEHSRELRAAYEEWADNQGGLQPDPAVHHAWIHYVLHHTLELPAETIAEGQAIPQSIKTPLPEYGETLRPSLLIRDQENRPLLLIQVLPAGQSLEKPLPKHPWKASPATRMMTLLQATELRLGLVTNGEQWMLVDAPRGETTGFVSWYAGLWLEEPLTLRAFRSLLGAERFFNVPPDQTLPALLAASVKDQHEVTDQLGYQVRQAVEILVQAIDRADQDNGRKLIAEMLPERLYEAALTVMMRLVFLLTAEERDLLLLGDPLYDQYYAASTLRAQLREMADHQGEEVLERRFDAWSRLLATFRVVYGGIEHENLKLPAYGGSLFDPDRFPFLEGRPAGTHWRTSPAQPLPINNRTVLHLLEALQILQVKVPGGGGAEARRLSFRALDIEQIGHVYEGLLDHVAARATDPVLGLQGTRNKEPEIPLPTLEAQHGRSEKAFLQFLREQTGRSTNALKNSLKEQPDVFRAGRLRRACGNDEALYQRVLPFAGLVRDDDYGIPAVIPAGSLYVTAGPTRRATGTHYTPRSLTEPIVQHTLEPLVYEGPAEGWSREEWRLRTPAELLNLKICDMAMGSGAFLVQACRYLSERLTEAWEKSLTQRREDAKEIKPPLSASAPSREPTLQITPEGKPATGDPGETLIPQDEQERLTLARRLVVDRCLYGVDKNHLAVEMAKLSLWLVTLDKNRPFTFLDHALKHGDSIIGADEDMFLRWAHSLRDASMPLFDQENRRLVEEARARREALQAFDVRDVRDAERKAQLLAEAEAAIERIKLGCDLLVGVRLLDDLSQSEQDTLLANALLDYVAERDWQDPVAMRAVKAAQASPAFHWPFEFPEVFTNGGFSAFVGNPPFLGNRLWGINIGSYLHSYAKFMLGRSSGKADLCSLFFYRAYELLAQNGVTGLIATDSIRKGDSRVIGLEPIVNKGTIFRALSSINWPGSATVKISVVWFAKRSRFYLPNVLDGLEADEINSYLSARPNITPKALHDSPQAFEGSHNGKGQALLLTTGDQWLEVLKESNSPFCRLYVTANDLNSHGFQKCDRWLVDTQDLTLEEIKEISEVTYRFLMEVVKPQRTPEALKSYPGLAVRWWQLWRHKAELYRDLRSRETCLAMPVVSKYVIATRVPTEWVFTNKFFVVIESREDLHLLLLSSISDIWMRAFSGPFGETVSLSITKALNTFPLPKSRISESLGLSKEIEDVSYMHCRENDTGFTSVYNKFNDQSETTQDIARLRKLHVDMDHVVTAAYGWDDLDLEHGFHETAQGIRYTISEAARRQVLTRLLKLNHERYAEEVRLGLHDKKGKKLPRKGAKTRKKKGKQSDEQLSLL